ncbi:hypothetical protein WJ972_15115 [Achromobacter insuavis]
MALISHLFEQALEPMLWGMVAVALLMLRLVPLQGWKAVIVAGITAGLVFDTIQFRVGPPRLWDALVLGSILAALLVAAVQELLVLVAARARRPGARPGRRLTLPRAAVTSCRRRCKFLHTARSNGAKPGTPPTPEWHVSGRPAARDASRRSIHESSQSSHAHVDGGPVRRLRRRHRHSHRQPPCAIAGLGGQVLFRSAACAV